MPATAHTPLSRLGVSSRDRAIIAAALLKLRGAPCDFAEAARALREAVEEHIAGGRVFVLGTTVHGPVVGSIISGVGIAAGSAGIDLVRLRPGLPLAVLARFLP